MKVNEVPEKIYIDANEDWHRTYTAFTEKAKGNDIEYTRTDAFIEKACEYLNNTCRRFILTEKDIEDFKNYMKGE